MVKQTRIFERLPPDPGIPLKELDAFISPYERKLESRKAIRRALEEFMDLCKVQKKPTLRILLGEWGEGKTDAYNRYIKLKAEREGNIAFYVTASALSNAYDLPYIKKLHGSTPLSSARFLIALFEAIRKGAKEPGILTLIPSPENYSEPNAYLRDALNSLTRDNKRKRIFIFIDEFEELLLNLPRLREIISGIKETINGELDLIDEDGPYEGCIHFIVAVTPDAYYQLQTAPDIGLIFGGLGRRAGVIELSKIRRREGIEFLHAILKYSYNDNLPQPLPIENIGVFNTLLRVSQGNLGVLVTLFTRLMNSARIDDRAIRVIDAEHILEFLKREQISFGGGSTQGLDEETFSYIINTVKEYVGERYSSLFKILAGELKPFSQKELELRIGGADVNVKSVIERINDGLRSKLGLNAAILKLCPLREGLTFNDVVGALSSYIVVEGEIKKIVVDGYRESLEDLEDRITYLTIDNGKIKSQIYLPCDSRSIVSFFEGISRRAEEIESIIKKLCKDEEFYIASEELLARIYPAPVPRELEFIKSKELRMQIWRDVTRNLAELYSRLMPEAFIDLLKRSGLIEVEEAGASRLLKSPNAKLAVLKFSGMKINCLFYAVSGDVKGADIEDISRIIEETKSQKEVQKLERKPKKQIIEKTGLPIHCVVLIYTGAGGLTIDAEKRIKEKGLGREGENMILMIPLHQMLIKRIISIYRAIKEQEIRKTIDEGRLSLVIKRIIQEEVDFQGKLQNWLKEQEGKGVVIKNLPAKSTSDPKELAGALRFYINFLENSLTPQEAFNLNMEILRFTKYGTKGIGIPDIELPEFSRLTEDLVSNGFLEEHPGGKYSVKLHPVEARILNILRRERKLISDDLDQQFIMENPRLLRDVFLPILEYKGLVKYDGKYWELSDVSQLYEKVKEKLNSFKQRISRQEYHNYGFIFICKQRGCRYIKLKDFEQLVEDLFAKAGSAYGSNNNEITLQKLFLASRLLQHFEEELLPLIENASREAKKILESAGWEFNQIIGDLERLRRECERWLKIEFDIKNVKEYIEISEEYDKIRKLSEYEEKDVDNEVDKWREASQSSEAFSPNISEVFSFRKSEDDAYYFNPKLYLLSQRKAAFDMMSDNVKNVIKEISSIFEKLDKELDEVRKIIQSKNVDEKYRISFSIYNKLRSLPEDVVHQIQPLTFEAISLKEISEYVQNSVKSLEKILRIIRSYINRLDKILRLEQSLLSRIEECERLSGLVVSRFDIGIYRDRAVKFGKTVQDVKGKFERFSDETLSRFLQKLSLRDLESELEDMISGAESMLKSLEEALVEEKGNIDKAWREYSQEVDRSLEDLKYVLELLKKRFDVDVKEALNMIEALREKINVDQVFKLELKLSEIESSRDQIRQLIYKLLERLLDKKEFELLEAIIRKTRSGKKEWLSYQELCEMAAEELGAPCTGLDKMLEKLVNLSLLRKGVSLFI